MRVYTYTMTHLFSESWCLNLDLAPEISGLWYLSVTAHQLQP